MWGDPHITLAAELNALPNVGGTEGRVKLTGRSVAGQLVVVFGLGIADFAASGLTAIADRGLSED